MAMANKKEKVSELNERLINQLPDEIVLSSILPRLTFKEVARSRLVSRHWNRIYHHISVFDFEKSSSKENIRRFVNRVNNVLGQHRGCTMDQFKVTFGLHNTYKSHIDQWVVFAFSKHVKKLDLDFDKYQSRLQLNNNKKKYFLHQCLLEKVKVKPNLTCLCLKSVDVTTQAVEHLLESCCSTLENLCIEESDQLTSIRVRNSLKSLKYFKVFGCGNLDTIDISAPKLLSFTYQFGHPLGFKLLRIANVLSLSRVSIHGRIEERLVHAIGTLFSYFSQLEYLDLGWILHPRMRNTVINSPPILANLKHLELCVYGEADKTMAGWIPFIEASPILQKLTLKVRTYHDGLRPYRHPPSRNRHPLRCLKTLEIIGFVGYNVDLDVANYVLENGVALQEVIVEPPSCIDRPILETPKGALDLKIPDGVKLIII